MTIHLPTNGRPRPAPSGLRLVAFNVFPPAFELVSAWAARRGHRIVLLVTSPGPQGARYGSGHRELIAAAPPDLDVLVTTRLKRVAAPLIAALAPDLLVSATFPHRIPPEVTSIPRFGALNLDPAPLPRGRGPNPQRLIYDGDLAVGGAVHRIAPAFDAGAILARHTRRLPDDVTPETILAAWLDLLTAALDEAVARAVAGDRGDPQDEARATDAAPFTDEERWLSWHEPAPTVQRHAAALNLAGPTARAVLDGAAVLLRDVRALPSPDSDAAPGTVLDRAGDTLLVATADGAARVTAEPLAPGPGSTTDAPPPQSAAVSPA